MMEMLNEEIDGKRYWFNHVFSIDLKFEDRLKSISIGDHVSINSFIAWGLKDEFEDNKYSLSKQALVTKVKGKENDWVITDRVNKIINPMYRCPPEEDIIMFLVRKEDGKLNIYKGTEKERESKRKEKTVTFHEELYGQRDDGLGEKINRVGRSSGYTDQQASYPHR